MPELRKHYFLDEYCIIAAERNKRPSDFGKAKAKAEGEAEGKGETEDEIRCPFCQGNEEMTPPSVAAYTDQGVQADGTQRIRNWKIRVFPNRFAAMVPSPEPPTSEWIALPGRGQHEVIVDSPVHGNNPADFTLDHMELLLQAYRDRYCHNRCLEGVKYVSLFKNWRKEAGASLSHSHSQLVALPITPPSIIREMDAISAAHFCLFCNIAEKEMTSRRLIDHNDSWVLFSPFYSQVPYETWIVSKRHISNLEEMNDSQRQDLAEMLRSILQRMRFLLDDPPYNYMIHQLPVGYHLNLRIQPAISKIAGFERGTGIYINSVPPEQAADELRRV
jgi:UDPglucose--hexose-1-phosphate uridylyltransferase